MNIWVSANEYCGIAPWAQGLCVAFAAASAAAGWSTCLSGAMPHSAGAEVSVDAGKHAFGERSLLPALPTVRREVLADIVLLDLPRLLSPAFPTPALALRRALIPPAPSTALQASPSGVSVCAPTVVA